MRYQEFIIGMHAFLLIYLYIAIYVPLSLYSSFHSTPIEKSLPIYTPPDLYTNFLAIDLDEHDDIIMMMTASL